MNIAFHIPTWLLIIGGSVAACVILVLAVLGFVFVRGWGQGPSNI